MKLNQLIAIVAGKKNAAQQALRTARDKFGQATLFEGHLKTYKPYAEDGDKLAEDRKNIQASCFNTIEDLFEILADSSAVVAGIDLANTAAYGSVSINGQMLMDHVPATQLIFLEKQLQEVRKVVASIPVLDPSVIWSLDTNQGVFRSEDVRSIRTNKVPTPFVKAEATPQHPAQVDLIGIDKAIGDYTSTRTSSAMPLTERQGMLKRIDGLIVAVVQAREDANTEIAAPVQGLGVLLKYVLPLDE